GSWPTPLRTRRRRMPPSDRAPAPPPARAAGRRTPPARRRGGDVAGPRPRVRRARLPTVRPPRCRPGGAGGRGGSRPRGGGERRSLDGVGDTVGQGERLEAGGPRDHHVAL